MVLWLTWSMDDNLLFSAAGCSGKASLIFSGQLFADFCHVVFTSMIQFKEVFP